MNNAGYMVILQRNSRKKMKPSMWHHCLRVYDKMEELERRHMKSSAEGVKQKKKSAIQWKTLYHEAALVAAPKLGYGKKKLKYITPWTIGRLRKLLLVLEWKRCCWCLTQCFSTDARGNIFGEGAQANRPSRAKSVVTDNMVLSIISTGVRGSKVK
ncbi:hypothetical protein ACHAW6_004027 [Cyclotella cf. meneghiniana]